MAKAVGYICSPQMGLWHSWLARFLDMEEVTGSSPVNPTKAVFYQKTAFLFFNSIEIIYAT